MNKQFPGQANRGPNTLQDAVDERGRLRKPTAHWPKMPHQAALESLEGSGLNRPLFLFILLRSSLLKVRAFGIRKSDFGV
jgi:hypothetical protein